MKKIICLAYLLYSFFTFAQYNNYIYANISEPRVGKWGQGKITQTNFEVTPKGLYAEVSLFLTFAANKDNGGYYYNNFYESDTVEYTLNFSLPTNASVIDSWLWIDNQTISIANLLEKGIARNTYEGIVKRRKDPSILYKHSNGYYELKVYPMIYSGERRVKITYLTPFMYKNNRLTLELPRNFTSSSTNYNYYYGSNNSILPNTFKIKINADANWNSISYYTQSVSSANLTHSSTTLQPNTNIEFNKLENQSLFLDFQSNFTNGIFYSQNQVGNEVFYQLGIVPNQLLNFPSNSTSSSMTLSNFDALTDVSNGLISFRQKNISDFSSFKSNDLFTEFGVFNASATQIAVNTKYAITGNVIYSDLSTFSGNNSLITSDSTLRKMWAGQRISNLESKFPASSYFYYYDYNFLDSTYIKNRNQVLFLSLKNRVLATNSSFLALEPGMVYPDCEVCVETKAVSSYANYNLDWQIKKITADNFSVAIFSDSQFAVTTIEEEKTESIKLFPNPTSGTFYISFSNTNQIESLELYDVSSVLVFEKKYTSFNSSPLKIELKNELNDLLLGVYVLKIKTKNSVKFFKVVVSN